MTDFYNRRAEVEKYGENRPFAPKQKKNAVDVHGKIEGEPITGFEKAGKLGEFECGNCYFFDVKSSSCGQVTMMTFSKQPRLPNMRVKTGEEDCCEFVQRTGRKDSDRT